MIKTPDWVKDAIFYQIFPDRFAKSTRVAKARNLEDWDSKPTAHGYKGGDLLGVAEKLDYLADLGVNAIYFCPIFQSTANHRYHTSDYMQVDDILGGNAALRELLAAAHARGMKIMLDGVFNHTGRGFYQFTHALENGAKSPYLDWFHFTTFPVNAYNSNEKPNYAAWWNIADLPKLNTATPAVRQHIFEVARYWIEFGADAWRLDVPSEIDDDEFWQEFRRQVKGINPEAYICGEIWENGSRWLQGDQFDSVMNYLFTAACLGFFIPTKHLDQSLIKDTSFDRRKMFYAVSASHFDEKINNLLKLYHPEVTQVQLNLLDSHDTARFLSVAKGDVTALKLATLFQFCYPGAPCIYYGDEVGMLGERDPDCRRSFNWDESTWNTELLAYFKHVIALRKTHSALRRGTYESLSVTDNCYVFGRRDTNEKLVVALNIGDKPVSIKIDPAKTVWQNYSGQWRDIFAKPGAVYPDQTNLTVPARSGTVFEVLG
jgi:cyclomaltodextrinase / maltogenic alpha-amylase / neopullulanase